MAMAGDYLVKEINKRDLWRGIGQDQLTADLSSILQQNAFDPSTAIRQNLLHWLTQNIMIIADAVSGKLQPDFKGSV